jgi:TetR/AcrR family transcriptional regulator, regulator of autoinduction and epiphytic fitness
MDQGCSIKLSFKKQMLRTREDAIVRTVHRLLCEKGFDAMTVDEVAAGVGIAKASLYKHFPSKEDLAAAAMVGVMQQAQAFVRALPAAAPPLEKLSSVTRWTLQLQLAGDMPTLPSHNSSLRAVLMASKPYMDGLMEVSDALGGWIEQAQAAGQINAALPAIAVLYTLFARACDPVLEFLKLGGQHSDAEIVEIVLATCFDGLNARTQVATAAETIVKISSTARTPELV